MKTKALIFAVFCASLLVFNGCTLFGGEDCRLDAPDRIEGDYPRVYSLYVDGQADSPAGQAPEKSRTLKFDADGTVTASYTLTDGRLVEETWQVREIRAVTISTNSDKTIIESAPQN